MGHSGGSTPDGLRGHQLKTLFLRAPYGDFPALAQGHKTEFRANRLGAISASIHTPTPVVLYAASGSHKRHALMVLEEYREERLLDVAEEEALRRECVADYAAFKRYWRIRTRRKFRALDIVGVFRLRVFDATDMPGLSAILFDRLYGEYAASL